MRQLLAPRSPSGSCGEAGPTFEVAARFAHQVATLRAGRGEAKRKQLAARLDMTQSMVSRFESGAHLPNVTTLGRIVVAFDRRLEIAFHEHEHEHVGGVRHRHGPACAMTTTRTTMMEPTHDGAIGVFAHPGDALYLPSRAGTAVLTNAHAHRHAGSNVHEHLHDHGPGTWHRDLGLGDAPERAHAHAHARSMRTTLLLIRGSSPIVEGIRAIWRRRPIRPGLIAVMAVVFAIATIGTYVTPCVASAAGSEQSRFGSLDRYGEVFSGAFIAIVGVVFLRFPVLCFSVRAPRLVRPVAGRSARAVRDRTAPRR